MAHDVDYIPVGNGEKSGDAIVLRFGNLIGTRQDQYIIVIDGGFSDSGNQIVDHIKQYYNTEYVDLVISTHPDYDHISGLQTVLEKLKVGALLMHKPWEHSQEIKSFFKDKRISTSGLKAKLEKSIQNASDLESFAETKNITIIEPFQGVTGYSGILHVLGPSKEYYESQIPLFRSTPAPVDVLSQFFAPIREATMDVINWLEDSTGIDLINDDEDTTSPENNTSAILLFNVDGKKLLFTGDSGKTALLLATDYATTQGISLIDLHFLDVPHHGSKRNLSSKVLSRIRARTAFVSASGENPKHPAKKITNALKKHGTKVYVNRKITLHHSHDAPDRPGWSTALEEPFHLKVEG